MYLEELAEEGEQIHWGRRPTEFDLLEPGKYE